MPHERSQGMTLEQLQAAGVEGRLVGDVGTAVHGVQHDSRQVRPGDLFVAVAGATHDGARFVEDAIAAGATAVMSENALDCLVPQLVVTDARASLGLAAELV